VVIAVAALGLAGFVGLSFLMAALIRSGVAGSPLGTALGLGCLMILFLGGSIGLLLAAAGRFADGSAARRTVIIAGLAVLMGFAPLLMILVVYLLSRGSTP
jgi:hypothetical protein